MLYFGLLISDRSVYWDASTTSIFLPIITAYFLRMLFFISSKWVELLAPNTEFTSVGDIF